jgi:hypothetical protein
MASPNPLGRPKLPAEVVELARMESAASIARLAWLRDNSTSDAVQLAASVALLDRGFGRPPQMIATQNLSPRVIVVRNDPKVIEHAPRE